MSDVLTNVAAALWIFLFFAVLYRLRDWNRKFQKFYDDMKKEFEGDDCED